MSDHPLDFCNFLCEADGKFVSSAKLFGIETVVVACGVEGYGIHPKLMVFNKGKRKNVYAKRKNVYGERGVFR